MSDDSTAVSLSPEAAPLPPAETPRLKVLAPLAVMLAGIALIALMAWIERRVDTRLPWQDAIFAPDAPLPESRQATPVSVRRLPVPFSGKMRDMWRQLGIDEGEYVVSLTLPQDELRAMLVSGTLPEPGAPEVLAGDLAPRQSFTLDGHTFSVVGKLKRGVAVLKFAYLLPEKDAFGGLFSVNATQGWYAREGRAEEREKRIVPWREKAKARDLDGLAEEFKKNESRPRNVPQALPAVTCLTALGMLLAVLGGATCQYRILRSTARSSWRILRWIGLEIQAHPRLFMGVNAILHGTLFAGMIAGCLNPVGFHLYGSIIRRECVTGSLGNAGLSFLTGDICTAALYAFTINFFQATLLETILPSMVIPFLGLLRNILRFGLIGFIFAPAESSLPAGLIYHSVTIIVELEAYILASFAGVMFFLNLYRGFKNRTPKQGLMQGLKTIASAAVVAAIILAIAALYESVTVIGFSAGAR